VRNRLAAETVCALLCLGVWSQLGHVHDSDLERVIKATPEVGKNDPKDVLKPGWACLKPDQEEEVALARVPPVGASEPSRTRDLVGWQWVTGGLRDADGRRDAGVPSHPATYY